MRHTRHIRGQQGFSLIEMMIAAVIFVLLCGAAFALLSVAQQRYQTESQVLNSFQEARFGLDDMVRDVNGSGYPPQSLFSVSPTAPSAVYYASTPIAWSASAGYPSTPCQIGTAGGGTCVGSLDNTPGDFDMIVERNPDPSPTNQTVGWTRYYLQNNILYRGQTQKALGGDPDGSTSTTFVPYVQNVMNNASPAQITQFRSVYPQMFPGGNPVPIFSYICGTPYGPQPCTSPSAVSYNSPQNVTDVEITLIVMAPTPDAQTGAPRLVELHGRGHSLNLIPLQ
jgi:prepilin-type N-terminal cleavage/methylation domain-containing protein